MADALTDISQVDAADIEAGRRLFAQQSRFVISAATPKDLPKGDLPEVAFAGRSNVGKSSLLNALTGRTALARTSGTPGRTRLLNFFSLGDRLMLVDLPGYGYAKASRREIAAWMALTDAYLRGRTALRRLFLLIDARHGLKDSDREMMAELDRTAVSFQVVLTKADKAGPATEETRAKVAAELAEHPAAYPEIAVTSAREGIGIPELRAALARLSA